MLITSYINRLQNIKLLYLVVFEILIPKFRNVFIESPNTYIHAYICVCVYVCACVCMYACVNVYLYGYMCVCVCIYVYMYL